MESHSLHPWLVFVHFRVDTLSLAGKYIDLAQPCIGKQQHHGYTAEEILHYYSMFKKQQIVVEIKGMELWVRVLGRQWKTRTIGAHLIVKWFLAGLANTLLTCAEAEEILYCLWSFFFE